MLSGATEARGWLVLPLVFKTNVGREERPGGVRFPYVSAILFRVEPNMIRIDPKILLIGLVLCLAACTSRTTQAPKLNELSVQDAKGSGKSLIQLVD